MPQTRLHTQLGSPKSRSSVNTNRVVLPSSSSQPTVKRATASIFPNSFGMVTTRSLQRRRSIGQSVPSSRMKSIKSSRTNPRTVPVIENISQLPPRPSTRISGFGLDVRHFSTAFQKLSVDECMFILHIYNWGIIQAKRIAALSGYKLQRPLPELLAMTSELDRNYSARSAKRKPLSGSSASSRKRSSGA